MNIQKIITLFAFTFFSHSIFAEEVVGQKDKKFSMTSLTVNVCDSVAFKNEDTFFHHKSVFHVSFS